MISPEPVPFSARLAELTSLLRVTRKLTPFAIFNAVYSCRLSVTEIGSANLEKIVRDEEASRRLSPELF